MVSCQGNLLNNPLEPGRTEGRNIDGESKKKLIPDSSDELHQPALDNATRVRYHKGKDELFTHEPHEGTNIGGRKSLPANLHHKGCPFQNTTRHRRSQSSGTRLRHTTNGGSSCPKRQEGGSLARKDKMYGIQVDPLFHPNNPLISLHVSPGHST